MTVEHLSEIDQIRNLINGKSLKEIINAVRALVGNPVMLTDLTHKLLCVSDEESINDPTWQEIIQKGGIPLDQLDNERCMELYKGSLKTEKPVLDSYDPNLPILRSAITCNGKLTGYLDTICYNKKPDENDVSILSLSISVLSFYMEKELKYGDSSDNLLDFFVADLLEGRITDQPLIAERFHYFGWDLKFPFSVIAIRSGFDFDGKNRQQREFALKQICQMVSQEFPDTTCLIYGQEIRLLFPLNGVPKADEPKIKSFTKFLLKNKLKAGISRPLFYIEEISSFHLQACKAWELGELLEDDAPLYNYDNYAIFHLFEYGSRVKDLMTFCHTSIFILAEYDRNHETDLLETLHMYLNCHCNIAEAATNLYIHRNTMNYRMSKIYELTNIDLDNTESFFHLLLSFHILEYYSITIMKDYELQKERKPTLKLRHKRLIDGNEKED